MRPHVCLFQAPPYDSELVAGGAEAVATEIVAAVAPAADVTILCGYPPGSADAGREDVLASGVRVLRCFPRDDEVWNHGRVKPVFNDAARRHLDAADLLITIERVLPEFSEVPTMTCLGGVAYPHAIETATSGCFDLLVVPSPYVLDQVRSLAPGAPARAITSGMDLTRFAPADRRPPDDGRVRLLLAARPEPSKGLARAAALTAALRRAGVDAVLQVVGDGLPDLGVPAEVMPWRPWSAMPDLYHQADMTLCLAEVPEGFGLTAAESVACGTPVLAHPAGFLASMFPPGHGLTLVPADQPAAAWVLAATEALATGRQQCATYGYPFAQANYSSQRARTEYRDATLRVLGLAA